MPLAIISEPKTVTVYDVRQVAADLIALSFVDDNVRQDNLYEVPSHEVMDTLLLVEAGDARKVEADLAPAASVDSHPIVVSAHVIESTPEAV